jgi:hypothetical protein
VGVDRRQVALAGLPVAGRAGGRRHEAAHRGPWLAETEVGLELLGLTTSRSSGRWRTSGALRAVMLEARGAIYTRSSVDFGAHDDCHCIAVPAFNGHPTPVKKYTPTSRDITDADRARTRDWISANL